jgi:hypothetical protein
VLLRITDNGIGVYNSRANDGHLADKTSMGISMTRERLERLSNFYGVNYQLDISDLSGNGSAGTSVSILLYARLRAPVDVT